MRGRREGERVRETKAVHDAGAIDEDVDVAEVLCNGFDGGGDWVFGGDIALKVEDAGVLGVRSTQNVKAGYFCADCEECLDCCGADAWVASCHDGDL
jgi:hypothetical protein